MKSFITILLIVLTLLYPNDFKENIKKPLIVELVRNQDDFIMRISGNDNKLGNVNNNFVSLDNPLGIEPNDVNGKDDIIFLNKNFILPNDREITFHLRTNGINEFHCLKFKNCDIIGNMVPGMVSFLKFAQNKCKKIKLNKISIECGTKCKTPHKIENYEIKFLSKRKYSRKLKN